MLRKTDSYLSTIYEKITFGSLPVFLCISFIALVFGCWFATNQITAVYTDGLGSYPIQNYFLTIFKCYLTIFAIFCLSQLYLSHLSAGKIKVILIAFTYFPLTLVYFNYPLTWLVWAIIILQLISLLFFLRVDDYQRLAANYSVDFLVLSILFGLHLFLTTRFSPLHWNMALLVGDGYYTEELPVLAPIFRGFLSAKLFTFTYVDQSAWGGIMNPPITLSSTLLQLLTFILDLPSVSYEAFHIILLAINFILIVLGSFGFYLFLKYAAKISSLFAFLGGFLFFFSGSPPIAQMFNADGGVLLSSYAVFPYALLAISLAFERNDMRFSAWAGVALASQFFFWSPHPEGVIYSFGFYIIYTSGLGYFTKNLLNYRKFKLAMVSFVAFLALSAFIYVPIIVDQLSGNMFVFAHTGDVQSGHFGSIALYIALLLMSAIILWFLPSNKKFSPIYLSTLVLSCLILLLLILTKYVELMTKLVHWFHIGLHFWYSWRISMYFCLTFFIIFCYMLDELSAFSWKYMDEKLTALLGKNKQ